MATTSKRWRCPHCGNTDTGSIESNGEREHSPNFTLLCTARVALGEDAFGGQASPPLEMGPDGKVSCGMQWSPNE